MIKNHGEKRKGAMMLVWYGRSLIALDGEPIKFNREERRLIVLDGEPIKFNREERRLIVLSWMGSPSTLSTHKIIPHTERRGVSQNEQE